MNEISLACFRGYGFLYVALCFFQSYDGHSPFGLTRVGPSFLKPPPFKKGSRRSTNIFFCLQVIYNDRGAASKGSIWFFSVPQVCTRLE